MAIKVVWTVLQLMGIRLSGGYEIVSDWGMVFFFFGGGGDGWESRN